MVSQNLDFEQIHDLTAFRIILNTESECYAVLGLIHSLWRPVQGRFKDYVAMPKGNGYQSLHTTVIGPEGGRIEIQIRTHEMDLIAEEGIAAHWSYKEGTVARQEDLKVFQWLRQMMEWQQDLDDPREFLENVRVDLYPDEVYVFTPKGEVKEFPCEATPLDFAYSIHTEVGHRCVGACKRQDGPSQIRIENRRQCRDCNLLPPEAEQGLAQICQERSRENQNPPLPFDRRTGTLNPNGEREHGTGTQEVAERPGPRGTRRRDTQDRG